MQKIELFQCEFCGTQYKDKQDCVRCEKNHKKPVKTEPVRYVPYKSDNSGYPNRIRVEFDDGKTVEYRR